MVREPEEDEGAYIDDAEIFHLRGVVKCCILDYRRLVHPVN